MQNKTAAESATLARIFQSDALARALPFLAYLAGLALGDMLERVGAHNWYLRWLYAVKIAAVCALLILFRKKYAELAVIKTVSVKQFALALLCGAAVFVAWINLNAGWMMTQSVIGFTPITDGKPDWLLIAVRMFGAALVVPVMEELFWRSLLLRWLDNANFIAQDPARISLRAFLVVTVLFGFEHNLWLAGIVAAIVYNLLYMATKNLWLPIVSHAVTNGMLGVWVVLGNHWEFW